MTGDLVEALEADAGPGPGRDGFAGVAGRARARARRGRRSRAVAWAAAACVVLGGAAIVLPSWDRGEEPQVTRTLTRAPTVFAEDLTGTVVDRTRGVASVAPAQASVLCSVRSEANPWAASSDGGSLPVRSVCTAAWAGDAPMLAVDPARTHLTAYVGEKSAVITVEWALRNRADAPLALDAGGVLTSLTTESTAVTTDREYDQDRFAGGSLWASNTQRYASLSGDSRPVTVEPGEYLQGSTRFTGTAPEPGAPRDAVWDIATGAAWPTLGVQIRVQPFGLSGATELFLEAETSTERLAPGVSADTLVADLTPRAPGESRDGAQAALLCKVPPELRPEPGGAFPYAAGEVTCRAGWLPDAVVVDQSSLALTAGEIAPVVGWGVVSRAEGALTVSGWSLLIESGSLADGTAPLLRLGSAVVTTATAWDPDGHRTALLDNATMEIDVDPGEAITGYDSLFPAMLTDGQPIDVDAVAMAIASGGAATAQVEVPFLDDARRVLILETPLAGPLASPSASP
ncbi:hypothetical protein [Demequina gelatinilytica]|uniref:hypothetical protein n=1 Tax=Demequina gelatinilytica TaxID=1638980 RepID=UPI000780ADD7|nr:hypothetical protein [Demequina gelatinilytica]